MMKQEELRDLTRAFRELDKTNSGSLTKAVFLSGMQNWERFSGMTPAEAEKLFEDLDDNKNNMIEYSEFCQASWSQDILQDQGTLRIAFNVLDHNNDGHISLEEASAAFGNPSTTSGDDNSNALIWGKFIKRFKQITQRSEGVNFDEFAQVMR